MDKEFKLSKDQLESYHSALRNASTPVGVSVGRVQEIVGTVIKVKLPSVRLEDICTIKSKDKAIKAQVTSFDGESACLTAFDHLDSIGPRSKVVNDNYQLAIPVSPFMLGRVVDSFGNPIDKKGSIIACESYKTHRTAPKALDRERIEKVLPTGIKAIDGLLSLGEGQRVGIISSAGVGKSNLLGMIARSSQSEVNVIGLIGERGREVRDFLEDSLGPEGLAKSVVVVSTSDEPPLRRIIAAYTATAIAEYFRDQGKRVTLLMDSLTRFARSMREIALSVGEPPVRYGYPPSVFTKLPRLLERAGKTTNGSITAIYTVLTPSEVLEDPVSEEIVAILDGHIKLKSDLANARHFPAIDVLASTSRLMNKIVTKEHLANSDRLKQLWAEYEANKDLISLGAYKSGSNEVLDDSIKRRAEILNFLRQDTSDSYDFSQTINELASVVGNSYLKEE